MRLQGLIWDDEDPYEHTRALGQSSLHARFGPGSSSGFPVISRPILLRIGHTGYPVPGYQKRIPGYQKVPGYPSSDRAYLMVPGYQALG